MKFLSNEEHSAARGFLISGMVWMAIGTTFGLIAAVALAAPDAIRNIPWLEFGRVRPVHVNAVTVAFVPTALLGGALYMVPALLRTRLHSERLGNATLWLWNFSLAAGSITLLLGQTQAREYAEYVRWVDFLVVITFGLLLWNLGWTIHRRQEPILYVSVWYLMGAVVLTAALYPIGNAMWNPNGAVSGIMDAVLLWFYGHNVVGLLLTPLAVGAAYYLIPVITRAPLYSHTLSLIGFWTLVGFYTHIGGHHLLQTPIPTWLKTISTIDSMLMMVPVLTVLINLWLTARGHMGEVFNSVPGKFVFFGSINYLVVGIQGPLQSLPSVQRITHYTNWTIGHAHLAVLGFAGMIALGTVYYVLPRVSGRLLWSEKLANLQFWLVFIGVWGFMLDLTAAGVVQGNAWASGQTVYRALPGIAPYMQLRAALGTMILVSAYLGVYNVVMTVTRGKRITP